MLSSEVSIKNLSSTDWILFSSKSTYQRLSRFPKEFRLTVLKLLAQKLISFKSVAAAKVPIGMELMELNSKKTEVKDVRFENHWELMKVN